jgi:hypothetical protein
MNEHALLMHTLMRHASADSPDNARRREHLLWLERERREARRRRRRQRVRTARHGLTKLYRTGSDDRMRRVEAVDSQALR